MKPILLYEDLNNLIILNQLNNEEIDWYNLCMNYQLEDLILKKYSQDLFYYIMRDQQLFDELNNVLENVIKYIDFKDASNIIALQSFLMTIQMKESILELLAIYTNYNSNIVPI